MPIFSAPKHNPLFSYFTNTKNSQRTQEFDSKVRFLRNDNDEFVYAKKIITPTPPMGIAPNKPPTVSRQTDFYIRLSPDLKTVFDTRERYCIPENQPDFVTRTCKNPGQYVKVSNNIFEKYLDFLETESESQYKELNRLVFRL